VRILVTNDDGIDSVGLHVLARALVSFGEVVIGAPDREYSGAGAGLGTLHLLQPEVRRVHVDGVPEAWSVTGPPALCVVFARLGVFGGPFDLVVSGINPGANTGRAIYHSGTVGAALTARVGGISGLAVSQAVAGFGVEGQGWDDMLDDQHWDTAAEVAVRVVEAMAADLDRGPTVVNVNVRTFRVTASSAGAGPRSPTSRLARWPAPSSRPRPGTRACSTCTWSGVIRWCCRRTRTAARSKRAT